MSRKLKGIIALSREARAAAGVGRIAQVGRSPWSDAAMLGKHPSAITLYDPEFAKQNKRYPQIQEGWDSGSDDKEVQELPRAQKLKSLVLVGNGSMGGSVLRGIHQNPELELSLTVVSPTLKSVLPNVEYLTPEESLGDREFDLIVFGIKPQMFQKVAPFYGDKLTPRGVVVSLLAGTSCETIAQHFPPRTAIVRSMPNLPAKAGAAMSGLYANEFVTLEQKLAIEKMFDSFGKSIWVEKETNIDAVTAISGSGPAYMLEFARLLVGAAMQLGFKEKDAKTMVLQTMLGAAKLAMEDPRSLEDLRKAVTSPKGTTAAGLTHLMREDVFDSKVGGELEDMLTHTVAAAYERAKQLREISAGRSVDESLSIPVRHKGKVEAFNEAEVRKKEAKESGSEYRVDPTAGHGFIPTGSVGGASGTPAAGSAMGQGTPGC